MTQSSKTFRIFISSTFSDMKEERNALQRELFPKLRELCMAHGCRFQAIDLRWGIRDEAGLDQQTVKLCLEEITRCQKVTSKPNLLILLGDRYGWRPLPYEIPADEFDAILNHLSSEEDRELLLLWYRRDDNAAPPVYCLLPRTGNYTDFRKWQTVEYQLRKILLHAIQGMDLTEGQRLKYVASATEQEIVHGTFRSPNPKEHVFGFFRTIQGLPEDISAKDFIDLDLYGNPDHTSRDQQITLKKNLRTLLSNNIFEYETPWRNNQISKDYLSTLCKDIEETLTRVILDEINKLDETDPLAKEIYDHLLFGKERAKFFTGRTIILKKITDYIQGDDSHPLAIYGPSGSGKSALIARAVQDALQDNLAKEVLFRFIGASPGSSDGRTLLESICRQISRSYNMDEARIPFAYQDLISEFPKRLALASETQPLFLFLDSLDQLSTADNARNLFWLPTELPKYVKIVVSMIPGECLSILEKKLPGSNLIELTPMPLQEGKVLLDLWLQDAGRKLQDHQLNRVLDGFNQCGLPLYLKLAFEEARRWKSFDQNIEVGADIKSIIYNLFQRLSRNTNHGEILFSRSMGYLTAAKNGLTEDEILAVLSLDELVYQDFIERAHYQPPEPKLPAVIWSRLFFDLEPYLMERAADETTLISFYHYQIAEVAKIEYGKGPEKNDRHLRLEQYFDALPTWQMSVPPKIPNYRKTSELPFQQISAGLEDKLRTTLTTFDFLQAKLTAFGPQSLIGDYELALTSGFFRDQRTQEFRLIQSALRLSGHILNHDPSLLAGQLLGRLSEANSSGITGLLNQAHTWTENPWLEPLNPCLVSPENDLQLTVNLDIYPPGHIDSLVLPSDHQAFLMNNRGEIAVIDLHNGRILRNNQVTPLPEHAGRFNLTSDGKSLVFSQDSKIEIRDLEDNRHPFHIETKNTYPEFWLTSKNNYLVYLSPWLRGINFIITFTIAMIQLFFHLDSKLLNKLFSLFSTVMVFIWDIKAKQCLRKLKIRGLALAGKITITKNGEFLIALDDSQKQIMIYSLTNGKRFKIIKGFTTKHTYRKYNMVGDYAFKGLYTVEEQIWNIERVAISNACNYAVLTLYYSTEYLVKYMVEIWDLVAGALKGRFEMKRIETMEIAPDDKHVIIALSDANLLVLDLEKCSICGELIGHSKAVEAIAVTQDGTQVITAGQDNTVRIWDMPSRKKIATRVKETAERPQDTLMGKVTATVFTPDSQQAIGGSAHGEIGIWDMGSGKLLRKFQAVDSGGIRSLFVTPDGKQLVSVLTTERIINETLRIRKPDGTITVPIGGEYPVKVWDIENGKKLLELGFHSFYAPEMTPDGRWLFGTIYLNIDDNPELVSVLNLRGGPGISETNSWRWRNKPGYQELTPDSRWIISADGKVRVFVVSPDGTRSFQPLSELLPLHEVIRLNIIAKKRLEVWDIEKTSILASFEFDAECSSLTLAPDNQSMIIGDTLGRIYLLRLKNFTPGTSRVIPWMAPDHSIGFGCPRCRTWSPLTQPTPPIEFPCPNCNYLLKLSPLIIENEWKWIAEAW
jgi:WD40 repeat protein